MQSVSPIALMRTERELMGLQPDALQFRLNEAIFVSASLALCYIKNGEFRVCALNTYKRTKKDQWVQKAHKTVPGGAWSDQDGNVLITAAREFVEEVFGRHDVVRTARIYKKLLTAWTDIALYPRLSFESEQARHQGYNDLNVHVSLRYLLDLTDLTDIEIVNDVNSHGRGCSGNNGLEKTANVAWHVVRDIQKQSPQWYRWGFSESSLRDDKRGWRDTTLRVVPFSTVC